jgi:hypothetical protein
MTEEKVACRTPTAGRDGVTRIPKWKFDALEVAIRRVVGDAGPEGLAFGALKEAVRAVMAPEDLAALGSLGWHMTSVKLEMEVRGDLRRLAVKGPQRLVLG